MKKIIIAIVLIAAAAGIVYQAMNPTEYKHPFAR